MASAFPVTFLHHCGFLYTRDRLGVSTIFLMDFSLYAVSQARLASSMPSWHQWNLLALYRGSESLTLTEMVKKAFEGTSETTEVVKERDGDRVNCSLC